MSLITLESLRSASAVLVQADWRCEYVMLRLDTVTHQIPQLANLAAAG